MALEWLKSQTSILFIGSCPLFICISLFKCLLIFQMKPLKVHISTLNLVKLEVEGYSWYRIFSLLLMAWNLLMVNTLTEWRVQNPHMESFVSKFSCSVLNTLGASKIRCFFMFINHKKMMCNKVMQSINM